MNALSDIPVPEDASGQRSAVLKLVLGAVVLLAVMAVAFAYARRARGPLDRLIILDATEARPWSYIVLHHSATTGGNARRFERNHIARDLGSLAYHFVIGNGHGSGDGQIEISDNWVRQLPCNHAGDAERNSDGIAICLVGDFEENDDGPTGEQMAALVGLIRYLVYRFDIDPDHVIGHNQVKNTRCPGRHFPLERVRAGLGEASAPGASMTGQIQDAADARNR